MWTPLSGTLDTFKFDDVMGVVEDARSVSEINWIATKVQVYFNDVSSGAWQESWRGGIRIILRTGISQIDLGKRAHEMVEKKWRWLSS